MAKRWAVAVALLAVTAAGCSPAPQAAQPSDAPSPPAASASVAPTPLLDLTRPGAARTLVRQLVAASGSNRVVLVTIKQHEAAVSVLKDGTPHTWAYRGGVVGEIASDLAYVDQAAFDPERFALDDVGALFRAAAAVSGSNKSQDLQIVDTQRLDHAASDIKMSVSTNPETRTVFFNADGTLVPTLDYSTPSGIAAGLADAVGGHLSGTAVGVGSEQGAYLDFVTTDGAGLARRQRPARLAVSVSPRPGTAKTATFDPRQVDPGTIWSVLQRQADAGVYSPTTPWSVVVDARTGVPQMHFTVGSRSFVTDLSGTVQS